MEPLENENIREYFTLASKTLQYWDISFPPWSVWVVMESGREVVRGQRMTTSGVGSEGPREEPHLLRGCPSITVRLESLPSTGKDKGQSVVREPEQEVGLGES